METLNHILVMGTIHRVLRMEKLMKREELPVGTLITPREVSADCGMVVTLRAGDLEKVMALAREAGHPPVEVWRQDGDRYIRIHDFSGFP